MRHKQRNIERRQHKRKDLYCLVKYKLAGEKAPFKEAVTSARNISGGGVLFKCKQYFPVNTELEMAICLFPAERIIPVTVKVVRHTEKIITVSAKVVRHERVGKKGEYFTGVHFMDIKEEDKNAIIRFAGAE